MHRVSPRVTVRDNGAMTNATNRRTFLGVTASMALLPGVRLEAAGRTAPGELRLGIASYSLRSFPRAKAIEMLRTLEVRRVSIKSFHLPYEGSPEDTRQGAREFRDAGIEVLSGGNIDLTDPARLREMFEYAKNAGLPMMVCAPSHETLDEVEKLAREYDVKIAIHNHGPEDDRFPSPESVLEAIDGRDRRMGLCIDLGHTARTGDNVIESIRRAGPRLFDVHIKDLRDLMDRESQVAVGDGAMPVAAIFRELVGMNYQGGVMLEYEIHPEDPVPGMMKSLAYMHGVLDGLV